MLKYISKALKKLQHLGSLKPQKAPAKQIVLTYGAKIQYAKEEENKKPIVLEHDIKYKL